MSNGTEQIFLPNSARNLPLNIEMLARPGSGALPTNSTNTINLENVTDFTKVCRVCATVTELVMPIFSGEGLRIDLAYKIKRHLPIKVTENDALPMVVCYQCTSTLLATHEMVECSLQADAALRTAQLRNGVLRRMRQRLAADTEVIVEDRLDKVVKFKGRVEKVLVNYFHTLNMDEGDDCQFACQKCSWKGYTTDLLVQHLYKHKIKAVEVETFIRKFITFEQPLESDDDTTAPPFKTKSPEPIPSHCCPFCESIFSSTSRLGQHIAEHVEISEDSAVECCGALYSERSLFLQHALGQHGRAPPAGATCRACGYKADSSATLKDHIQHTHAVDAIVRKRRSRTERNPKSKDQKYIPSRCPDCGKEFSNKYNMAVHFRSHIEKPAKVQCEFCSGLYSSRNALIIHTKLAHSGLLRFACNFCGERFPNRSVRDTHSAIHTGERPHACIVEGCASAFRSRDSLLKHLDTHKTRTYTCHCGKAFRRRWHLQRHLKTHRELQRSPETMVQSTDLNADAI